MVDRRVDREQDPGQTDAATSWLKWILQNIRSPGAEWPQRMHGKGTPSSRVTPSMHFPTRTEKLAWLHAGGQGRQSHESLPRCSPGRGASQAALPATPIISRARRRGSPCLSGLSKTTALDATC